MNNITDEIMDFKRLEMTVFKVMCFVACRIMEIYLNVWDRILMARRDTKEYKNIDVKTRVIKTITGDVVMKRRYYKKKSGGYVYLLDEAMGISKEYGLVSENLAEQIVNECSEKSFRKAARSIGAFTGQAISAMGAWGVFRQFGEKLEKQETRLKELDESGNTGLLGNLSSEVLFGEVDDVWLSMQNEKRRKRGEKTDKAKKAGKKPMHVGTAYIGWEKAKDCKYKTVGKVAYAANGNSQEFLDDYDMYLRHCFDMDNVKYRVTNGDGANWITKAAQEWNSIHQLDPFHRGRAIIRAVADKNDRRSLFKAIKNKDVEGLLDQISEMAANTNDEKQRKKLKELYGYFHSNKDLLLTWKERGIELPSPPLGIVYRELGTQEASNFDFVGQRMKRIKGGWSIKGSDRMAKTICFRNTVGFDKFPALSTPSSDFDVYSYPLMSAKAPLYDGSGYDGAWLHAELPFANAFRTFGRDLIDGLCKIRPLSEWAFL